MLSEPLKNEGELPETVIMDFEADEPIVKLEYNEHNEHNSEIYKAIDADENNTLLTNLILKCKIEMERKFLLSPLDDYIERVANYTGLSKTNIQQFIIGEMSNIDLDNKHFELCIRIQIFKWISDMYVKKQIPTYRNIYALMKNSLGNLNCTQFQYMMNLLGFKSQLTESDHEILVEDPELIFERLIYFQKLNNLKSNLVPIYYIDEVFVDKTFSFPKPWVKNIDVSCKDCDGYVFFHAVSNKGFLHGLFCSPTTPIDFMNWIAHFIIPQLKDHSVIVLDQNHLHRSNKHFITKYHSKKEMVKYLQQYNIPCDEKLHKAEVYKLIKDCTPKNVTFDVDELLKAHGHQVLWLPATYHDLSMTHFLWKYIIENKRDHIMKSKLQEIKNEILQTIIDLQSDLWQTFFDDLHKTEIDIFMNDSTSFSAFEDNFSLKNVLS